MVKVSRYGVLSRPSVAKTVSSGSSAVRPMKPKRGVFLPARWCGARRGRFPVGARVGRLREDQLTRCHRPSDVFSARGSQSRTTSALQMRKRARQSPLVVDRAAGRQREHERQRLLSRGGGRYGSFRLLRGGLQIPAPNPERPREHGQRPCSDDGVTGACERLAQARHAGRISKDLAAP